MGDPLVQNKLNHLYRESNLKQQRAIKETDSMNEEDLSQLRGTIECEEPHPLFYTFHARLKLGEKTFALDSKQLLLRVGFISFYSQGD